MIVRLYRDLRDPAGTFGKLTLPGGSWHTCEDDYFPDGSKPKTGSCIPAGTYVLRRRWSPKHKCELFGIEGVPNYRDVEIHPGNTEEDTLACVLLGLQLGQISRQDEDTGETHLKLAVLQSRQAFDEFMLAMKGIAETTIDITWAPGLP